MANDGRLVWIDCEMTGLDLASDALVEIAAVVTDSELNVLGDGVDIVIRPPDEAVAAHGPRGRRHAHRAPGCSTSCASGTTLADAEAQVLAYIREHVPEPRKAPLAGSSVYTDRGFIARDLPALDAYLHYRLVDVSSIKELSRRWFPRAYFAAPAKHGGHRALADILESIEELRYYREAVFVPAPGPDSATAREIASRYGTPPPAEGVETEAAADGRRRRAAPACRLLQPPGSSRRLMVGVAQLVEHLVVVQGAAGSSPVTHPTLFRRLPPFRRPDIDPHGVRDGSISPVRPAVSRPHPDRGRSCCASARARRDEHPSAPSSRSR